MFKQMFDYVLDMAKQERLSRVLSPGERRARTTTLHATNGTRECARRLRQIEAGRLTVANGVVAVVS